MKQLKFAPNLPELILSGKKYATWRLSDDPLVADIQVGDTLSFVGGEREFAQAFVISTKETTFANMTEEDKLGHEKYPSEAEKYATFQGYYGRNVGSKTRVKIIKYKLT